MKIKIFLILAAIVLTNCKKGLFETCVEGKVLNKKTGGTVANQKVYLLRQTAGNGFGGLGFEAVSSTTTSLGGYYKFVFKAKGETYFIQGTDDSNNDPRFFAGQPTGSIKNGKTSTVDVELDPKSKIILRFKNNNPFNTYDKIGFKIDGDGLGAFGNVLNGSDIDESYTLIFIGENTAKLNYEITKNNVITLKDTSFFVKSFETVNITINY
jgi:hypothetical protein